MADVPVKVLFLTKNYVAIIDRKDWKRVKKHKWHVHFSRGKGRENRFPLPYARATIKGKKVYLHRFITGAYAPMHVDHDNHCTLDCRISNLKVLSHEENQQRRRNVLAKRAAKTGVGTNSAVIGTLQQAAE
jgi:hypothetical protein